LQLETISFALSPRGIAGITLNRPERRNAFNAAMLAELYLLFGRIAEDEQVRLAVLAGGGKHFCAGADLADTARPAAAAGTPPGPALHDLLASIDRLPKPTIAVVQGGAIGGGAAITACCDIVVASDAAFFSIPEVRVGIAPVRLAPIFIRAMGQRNFRRYGITGERIDAAEAQRIGLAHAVCPAEALSSTVADIADALLHGAPTAIRELKAACAALAVPASPSIPTAEPAGLARSAEAIEGIASFREKRKPKWYPW
jgi:methylglutaconyl-CoA hydratase